MTIKPSAHSLQQAAGQCGKTRDACRLRTLTFCWRQAAAASGKGNAHFLVGTTVAIRLPAFSLRSSR